VRKLFIDRKKYFSHFYDKGQSPKYNRRFVMKNKLFFGIFGIAVCVALAAIVGFTFIGCNTSTNPEEGAAVAKEDLVGTWHKSGATYPRLTLKADDSWSGEFDSSLGAGGTSTWSVSGSKLTLNHDDGEDPEIHTVALSEDKKTLTVSSTSGTLIPVFTNGTYVKQ
jgi:hypothetical protein